MYPNSGPVAIATISFCALVQSSCSRISKYLASTYAKKKGGRTQSSVCSYWDSSLRIIFLSFFPFLRSAYLAEFYVAVTP